MQLDSGSAILSFSVTVVWQRMNGEINYDCSTVDWSHTRFKSVSLYI
jgi:hypothetical protein